MLARFIFRQFEPLFNTIRDCMPILWSNYSQLHLSFETWLIKAREHSETVKRLKLRVKILLIVLAICESV